MSGAFSTFELPIRKLIKLILTIGAIGATAGTITFITVASQTGMFKPDALAILGNAIWVLHSAYPALFLIYVLFGSATFLLLWLDRRHQKSEKKKRIEQIILGMKEAEVTQH